MPRGISRIACTSLQLLSSAHWTQFRLMHLDTGSCGVLLRNSEAVANTSPSHSKSTSLEHSTHVLKCRAVLLSSYLRHPRNSVVDAACDLCPMGFIEHSTRRFRAIHSPPGLET